MESREITEAKFIECLAKDFPNLKITKSNLTHPTTHFVISFYANILRHIIELGDPEKVWNLTEDQLTYMNTYHPDAATFGQHVWANNLHAVVKYVFSQLSENGTEFVYSDILFPENTPKRSFVFMALMLNFYWYSNDFAFDLINDMNACLEEGERMRTLKTDRDQLINQLKDFKDQRSQYAESFRDIKKFMKECADSNEQQENVMKELLSKESLVQKDLEKVEEAEQKLQESLTKLQNEEKRLECLIVSDQNQVIDIHQKKLAKKDECVKKLKTLEGQVMIASSKPQQCNKILELQQKLIHYLKDEKFLPNVKQKSFQSLSENLAIAEQNQKKIMEEESVILSKVSEAEEIIPKLESEYKKYESLEEEILQKGKKNTGALSNAVETQKKNHSQLFIKMRKDAEEVEEFASHAEVMTAECDEKKEKIKNYDADQKNRYSCYVADMKAALSSLQAIFGEDRKFF